MKFRIVLEYDSTAECFSVVCPELPGCASMGETEEEARLNIKGVIALLPGTIEDLALRQCGVGRGPCWVILEFPG